MLSNIHVICLPIFTQGCPSIESWDLSWCRLYGQWASYQIRKIAGCACAGNAGIPSTRVSDPDMHHGTCATHVPWCMPGSLNSGVLWSRWRGKRSRHFRRMRNPQFYVSSKRPMACHGNFRCWATTQLASITTVSVFDIYLYVLFERCYKRDYFAPGLQRWSWSTFTCGGRT